MASYYQRVKRTSGYTIMSNYHLRDMNLSLKASGLLSLVLSLPEDWQYSVKGLTAIVKEGESAVKSALQELEQHGYLRRTEIRTESGKFQGLEYIFLEYPGQLEDLQNPNGQEQTIQNMQKKWHRKCKSTHKKTGITPTKLQKKQLLLISTSQVLPIQQQKNGS